MNTSIQPSSLKSAIETPIPLPGAAANPDFSVTSSNLPFPEIPKEPVRNAGIAPRIAIEVAVAHHTAGIAGRTPERVVGDDQVQQAVIVIVKPGSRDAQGILRFSADARIGCHVRECSVTVIVVQGVSPDAAQEKIFVAVVVVVAYRHAEVEIQLFAGQPGFAVTSSKVPSGF